MVKINGLRKIANYINQIDSHHKLYSSVGISVLFLIVTIDKFQDPIHYMFAWAAYVGSTLILAWITILSSHPTDVKQKAHAQDSSRTVIFFFVIATAFASLLAVIFLLENPLSQAEKEFSGTVLIPLACVAGSWWLLHTVFTLHYAHLYYCDLDHHQDGKNIKPEGLIFPNEGERDYIDFTYFSFVNGMTFHVSYVQITSRNIRRLAWMHGVLAFAFNTFIVALTINIIAGLTQKINQNIDTSNK